MPSTGPWAGRRPVAVGPVESDHPRRRPGEDSVDRHVRRWSEWEDLGFDPLVEEVITRIQRLDGLLGQDYREAVRAVGLELHDYDTLHALHIRDTPGYATTGELAAATGVSPATMTGRVDRLVRNGLVTRTPSEDDRRVVNVQVTDEGFSLWRQAMGRRGAADEALLEGVPIERLRQLANLLRDVLLAAERRVEEGGGEAS